MSVILCPNILCPREPKERAGRRKQGINEDGIQAAAHPWAGETLEWDGSGSDGLGVVASCPNPVSHFGW